MNIILNFLGSPKVGDFGIRTLKSFAAFVLLGVCMFFPVAGWHRIFLKIPGWQVWPVCGFLGTFGVLTAFIFHQQSWIVLALPLSVLLANDCVLIISNIWSSEQ